MAAVIRGIFGANQLPPVSEVTEDADFPEFAKVPVVEPEILKIRDAQYNQESDVIYTKWYNIHERHSPKEFLHEAIIISFLLLIVVIHLLGTNANRKKAKNIIATLGPSLHKEFGLLGFEASPSLKNEEWHEEYAQNILREKSPSEFESYATGRQNVAFLDLHLSLSKRFSPLSLIAETTLSVFFDTMPTSSENIEAIIYPFDGKESLLLPGGSSAASESRKHIKSAYDGFVWAIVNKDNLKQIRNDRYDLSLTITKDNSKLPKWATVMSESSEITETLLTPELIRTVEQSQEFLRYLIITDQPIDKPVKIEETTPRKRIFLNMGVPTTGDYTILLPIFQYFLRLTDILVQQAHFRPEVLRKVTATREESIRKLLKFQEDQKAEERSLEREKAKKLKRDLELQSLNSKAQKKYLEKEKEKEIRKSQKKATQKR